MKNILVFLCLLVFSFSGVSAYSIVDFENKKADYRLMLDNKFGTIFDSYSKEKLNKLVILVDKLIFKYDNNIKLSDEKKLDKLSLFYAVKDILYEKIDDYSEGLVITIIDDKRCTDCYTDSIIEQLKEVPSLSEITIKRKDFSDKGVDEYLKKNNVNSLPLFIFSTNDFDTSNDPVSLDYSGNPTPTVKEYLIGMNSGDYFLPVGANFNPYEKRSEKGFLVVDKEILNDIKEDSYIKGNTNAKITWIEYSDLECPYCARLHNSGTPDELFEKYGDDLNMIYNHFPLAFHENAQIGAEIVECVGKQLGSEKFYELIDIIYLNENSDDDFIGEEAEKLGTNMTEANSCFEDGTYTEKVTNQMQLGTSLFNITGTPGNVLINNETGEYKVISGAYPTSEFINVIDELLE